MEYISIHLIWIHMRLNKTTMLCEKIAPDTNTPSFAHTYAHTDPYVVARIVCIFYAKRKRETEKNEIKNLFGIDLMEIRAKKIKCTKCTHMNSVVDTSGFIIICVNIFKPNQFNSTVTRYRSIYRLMWMCLYATPSIIDSRRRFVH